MEDAWFKSECEKYVTVTDRDKLVRSFNRFGLDPPWAPHGEDTDGSLDRAWAPSPPSPPSLAPIVRAETPPLYDSPQQAETGVWAISADDFVYGE